MSKGSLVQLSHGGGGVEMNDFIHQMFFNHFGNEILLRNEDAATLTLPQPFAMTTDSFTVAPHFFPGGNIGSLAIAGTCNDLAMVAAKPSYLSCGFMIEEGTDIRELETIVCSMAEALTVAGAQIVCGDTKIVPRGSVDKVFINTTGVGHILKPNVSAHNLHHGDVILVSRDIGCHGASVLAEREALKLEHSIESDCAVLWPTVEALLEQNIDIHAMRDATRGGLAAVLNEWCQTAKVQIRLNEAMIPVHDSVCGVCELFGFEPYDLANEGTFVLVVDPKSADAALSVLRQFQPLAAMIGEVSEGATHKPILQSAWGSRRYLDFPQGELLPRIC